MKEEIKTNSSNVNKILGIVIGIVLLFTIIYFLFIYNSNAEPVYDSVDDCDGLNQTETERCYNAVSSVTQDKSLCENIREGFEKDDCLLDIACMTSDISICSSFDSISLAKDSCYDCVAKGTNDPSICENIADENLASQCKSQIA
jgi:hypothetical protein